MNQDSVRSAIVKALEILEAPALSAEDGVVSVPVWLDEVGVR